MDKERLRRLTGRQFGLFTRAQARECGFSAGQIRHRLADGQWQQVLGSTLAVAGLRITTSILDRAAQLAVPGSILAGPSAARIFGIPVPDRGQYLYLARHRSRRLAGVRFLYETPDRRDIVLDQGLPATGRARTVVDCLRLLPWADAVSLVDRALQQGWLSVAELITRTTDRAGRPGAPRLVTLVRLVSGGERATSERLLTRILRAAGIRGWRTNVEIRDERGRLLGQADVAFDRRRLVLEVDGWAYHSTPDRFQRDRRRQNRLVAAGWRVLRFTWRDLTERPDQVVATVRRLLS